MKMVKFRLDVALRGNAGVMDVVDAIEKAVNGSSDDVLAAEVVFDLGGADAPAKRKKRKYVRKARYAGLNVSSDAVKVERRGTIPAGANARDPEGL